MKPYHLGHRINILGRVLSKRLHEGISATGITSSQWPVIARLLYCNGLTQTEICEQLSIEAPAISKTICNLEAAGWVIRSTDDKDKREKKVTLTDKARSHLPIWLQTVIDLETQELKGISNEDLVIFNRVLEQILQNSKDH
ncbi:MAG TPA: MarR family transcriptional regulator [Methylomusa anaerophila]|uniref:Transcriptional regulator SlyA n=1 Tax=Methylomusa anaerophila TaxID=1930071 RepID=A0A348AK47_9FIRM|nr:MarR family transcriptional regulator [Methylomusa anaerophila]BBB91445.1 transcriptional regulator SlyA [Methylomusa anaerophila]HML90134.1 MarR family transcriptional regulator [Methylomusa anaerophila]